MSERKIEIQKFAQLVVAEFPELEADFQEWQGLEHLQVMEFAMFSQRAMKDGDWHIVEKCLKLVDFCLRHGDAKIRNAIYVSYLENLPRDGRIHNRVRAMMTPELRQGWDHILAYLSGLAGNDRS